MMLHLMLPAILMAWMFSLGCCCETSGVDCDSGCNTGKTPAQAQLTFANVENDSCTECGDFNTTTFIIDQDGINPCLWIWTGAIPCDGETNPTCAISLGRDDGSGGRYFVSVVRDPACDAQEAIDTIFITAPSDCVDDTIGGDVNDHAETLHCKWSTASTPATWSWVWV